MLTTTSLIDDTHHAQILPAVNPIDDIAGLTASLTRAVNDMRVFAIGAAALAIIEIFCACALSR